MIQFLKPQLHGGYKTHIYICTEMFYHFWNIKKWRRGNDKYSIISIKLGTLSIRPVELQWIENLYSYRLEEPHPKLTQKNPFSPVCLISHCSSLNYCVVRKKILEIADICMKIDPFILLCTIYPISVDKTGAMTS